MIKMIPLYLDRSISGVLCQFSFCIGGREACILSGRLVRLLQKVLQRLIRIFRTVGSDLVQITFRYTCLANGKQ